LVEAGGSSVRAILLYGSHLLRAAPDRHSAVDLVVIVRDYGAFHRELHRNGELPRPPWLMTALARVLPPNVIAFTPDEGRDGIAKCLILSEADFQRGMGPRAKDHFLIGRLVQKVALLWAATPEDRASIEDTLGETRAHVLDWMAPYLEGPFDAEALGSQLLTVCYRGELRPEARNRAQEIHAAQADHFGAVLQPAIERGLADGTLVPAGGGVRLAWPAPRDVRRRWRGHFRRSKARATLRWLKHTVTFANWLPYVTRKVERHTGRQIVLTPLERKLPLIFLWPRAIKLLLTRPERRGGE